jgi:hypothetical protein
MNRGKPESPRHTSRTIDDATPIQTPSQAEHGLEGVFVFNVGAIKQGVT